MHDHRTTVLDPLPDLTTLDGDRADRFGTFLTVEAAASARAARSAHRSPRRRALTGVVAAGVLAAGLLTANAIVGGPGPASVDPAVAIEQANGWTTISIVDPDAAPAEIEAELEAAGIDARLATDGDHRFRPAPASGQTGVGEHDLITGFSGMPITVTGGPEGDADRAFYLLSSYGGTEVGDLVGLALDFELPADFSLPAADATITTQPAPDGGQPAITADPFAEAYEDLGVRIGGDLPLGTVSIADGSDVEVVLYAQP